MSSDRKTVTVFLAVICGLLLAIVDVWFGWPLWGLPILAAVPALVAVALLARAGRRRRGVPPGLEPYLPVEPVERRSMRVSEVALPSTIEDYDFRFTATVRWCPVDGATGVPVVNPGGLAVQAVLQRARQITELRDARRSSLVQRELDGALGIMEPDASGLVLAMAEEVTLTLTEHDQARLDKLASVRKDEQVWEHERKWEQSRRAYLGDDVLKDPGSAVIWWLVKNDDHVERTVGDLGLLAQLSSAANNEDVPDRFRHLVPYPEPEPESEQAVHPGNAHVDEYTASYGSPTGEPFHEPTAGDRFEAFLRAADFKEGDPRRDLFALQVAKLVSAHGNTEVADDLEQRFRTPGEVDPEEPDPGFEN
ncbi:hypothetical protein [Streptomyces sp. SID3343]|uniref:hypothetical protein n=1 Tax=Streptomyces sp. SID3343 TaxID=2690260 RepID=UPI001367A7BC|nr:hypothetical protein [Streptomyces sp. SID3343]MYV97342.1 hypothetical protein [Streptomyces sp. SID3343]